MNNEIKDKVSQDLKESGGIRAEYIITENSDERISILWLADRFAIKHHVFAGIANPPLKTTVLNTREALDTASFIFAVHSLISHRQLL